MPSNATSIEVSSNGAWQGDNPLSYAFPLLIIQTTLVLLVSRSLTFLLKPLRQPKVIAEILGGILLGPSVLGRNKAYLHRVFPLWSMPILESVASIGLLFFLFLVGLELDLSSIRRSGRRAFGIAAAGISFPFICGIGVSFILRKTVHGANEAGYGQFLVFMGVALSITAFPVLARILAELKLLTTQVGETAMAAAALNDVVAWVLLALAVALAGNGDTHNSPLVSIWVLISGVTFVAFMLLIIRPAMNWVGTRCSPEQDSVNEAYICLTLAGVMVSGFTTDLIGIHSIFGAFVFGLTIPKGDFKGRLIERIEDFVSGLLLPLYFASSGLKTDVAKIRGVEAWGLWALVMATACAGKILGTFAVAMLNKIPARGSLTLGVLMNTKGLVELIVLNIGKEKKVLNDEIFAILVLMALISTFMTTPTVMAIYKPAPCASLRKLRGDSSTGGDSVAWGEFRVLACIHGPGNVPSLINLIESTRGTKDSPLKLYVMNLVELTERSSSIIMAQRARRNGLPSLSRDHQNELHDRALATAFKAYSQLGRVRVRPMTAISALPTMHEDVCHVAEQKRVALIILPFHKGDMALEAVGPGWRCINQRILTDAPCSVAVLVDRGLGGAIQEIRGPSASVARGVCVVFFGGPDDREALEFGGRMAEHPGVTLTVVRFVERRAAASNAVNLRPLAGHCVSEQEKELDEATVEEFKRRYNGTVKYIEKVANNIVEGVLEIGRSSEFELIVVGRDRFPSWIEAELADVAVEHAELGQIGDTLASSGHGVVASVLVVQQHQVKHAQEVPLTQLVDSEDEITKNAPPRTASV